VGHDWQATMNVDVVLGLSGLLAYLVVGLMAAGESAAFVGLFLPGETVMVLGGVLAATGHANLMVMILVAVAGAIAGDAVGYGMGRALGPILRTGRLGRAVGPSRWDRAEDFVTRRGPVAVFLGRWIGILRALVPAVAGVVHMPFRRFLLWNAIGGASWGTAVVLLGYLGGTSYTGLESRVGLGWTLLVVAVVALVSVGLVWLRRRRAIPAGEPASGGEPTPDGGTFGAVSDAHGARSR
jgi:membrane-associated protein